MAESNEQYYSTQINTKQGTRNKDISQRISKRFSGEQQLKMM